MSREISSDGLSKLQFIPVARKDEIHGSAMDSEESIKISEDDPEVKKSVSHATTTDKHLPS